MPNPATIADITDRWRPLSAEETTVATTLLNDAWLMLKRQATSRGITDLEAQITASADLAEEVSRMLALAVIRVLRNPDGVKAEQIDDYSYTRAPSGREGELFLDDADLDALFPGAGDQGRAFMVDPIADYATRIL